MPVELARLWRISSETRRGRPARLDVDAVVDAAIALADRDGLAAATLPKVAESLGVTKMSLYRHVGSKEELVALMADAAGPPPADLREGDGPWRERLGAWAEALADRLERHPWLADLRVTGPPSGPNGIAWFDAGLRAMRRSRLDWGPKVRTVMIVSDYVQGMARLAQGLAAGRGGADQAAAELAYGKAMAALVDPARFPDAAALFASDTFADTGADTAEADFRFGLDLILDGVAAQAD
ncbi:TetR/AcrR family transcriptional regulator [Glycomyces paridis]|uniref:TetR/AcrR family transcriptional regulator n=1 Tax=Glycomyces paridis TaxID=2126555 RepID=A0A4S8PA46_9ACTN|nr:TetR/AcrR family transcriptional regulator [Glycomyces paridis]